AFRMLALSTRATDVQVRRRAQELRMQAELEGDNEEVARLKDAHARLEDAATRLEEELFWFALTPDPVPEDLHESAADFEQRDEVESELAALAKSGSDEAAHDLAVLRHVTVLETSDGDTASWRPALQAWEELWRDDRFWMRMRLRADELGDPRVTDAVVDRLRKRLPDRILDATATEIADLLQEDCEAQAAKALEALRDSTFPAAVVSKARAAAVGPLAGRVKDIVSETRASVEAVEADRLSEAVREQWSKI